jgi:hypothetical protein
MSFDVRWICVAGVIYLATVDAGIWAAARMAMVARNGSGLTIVTYGRVRMGCGVVWATCYGGTDDAMNRVCSDQVVRLMVCRDL